MIWRAVAKSEQLPRVATRNWFEIGPIHRSHPVLMERITAERRSSAVEGSGWSFWNKISIRSPPTWTGHIRWFQARKIRGLGFSTILIYSQSTRLATTQSPLFLWNQVGCNHESYGIWYNQLIQLVGSPGFEQTIDSLLKTHIDMIDVRLSPMVFFRERIIPMLFFHGFFHIYCGLLQGGAPPVIIWFIIPITIDITPINPSYSTYNPT